MYIKSVFLYSDSHTMAKEKLSFKNKLVFIFLGFGTLCLAGVPALFFVDFPNKASTILILLITGEVLFLLTIALTGKGYLEKIKESMGELLLFRKKKK